MDGAVPLGDAGAGTHRRLTRRSLLRAGGATLAVAAVGGGLEALAGAGADGTGAATGRTAGVAATHVVRRSDFTPHVGRRFSLVPDGGAALQARLVAISDFSGARVRGLVGSEDAFTLLFHTPAGAPRPGQAVMEVIGPGGSAGRLLLSPAGPGRYGLDYGTVINRVIPPGGR